MTDEFVEEMVAHACMDNAEAIDFIGRALAYFHAADDLVDECVGPEDKLKVLIRGQELFTHSFFMRHSHALNAVIRMCESTYADSVAWEKSEAMDKRAWAEYARHIGFEVILTVADIMGGWAHRRKVSGELRQYQMYRARKEKEENEKG